MTTRTLLKLICVGVILVFSMSSCAMKIFRDTTEDNVAGGGDDNGDLNNDVEIYGSNDFVTTSQVLAHSNEYTKAIAVQADGKIIAAGYTDAYDAGDLVLARYNNDGTPDISFGVDGIVVADDMGGNGLDEPTGIAIQADGKIVVSLSSTTGEPSSNFVLARYDSDGKLDESFGDKGIVSTDLNKANSGDVVYGIAIQPDGKILATGYTDAKGTNDIATVRYKSDGSIDETFGVLKGMTITDVGGNDYSQGIALQSEGSMFVAGWSDKMGNNDFVIIKYTKNGLLDNAFGTKGIVMTDIAFGHLDDVATAVTVQADGKPIVAGYSNARGTYDLVLVRYKIEGSLDSSFGPDLSGMITTDIDHGYDVAYSVIAQTDGTILVAGYSSGKGTNDFTVAKYDREGKLDVTFGTAGIITEDLGSHSDDVAYCMAVQPNGKIVVGGYTDATSGGTEYDLALMRF